MIYLFDRAKKLQKIIPRKHIINANPTVVRNGIYQLAVEVPLFYEDKKGTKYNYQKSVGKAEFAGHYDDKNRFQLYKIYSRNITANEQGEFLLFDGVHIFFDEAKAMGNIHDRRFRDSEAKAPADAAFNSIGWTVIDYDVTDRHDINFYRASVTDAWNDLISIYGVEFDYELQFDGRKIISKNIIMKKQLGKWTGQRFAYGTNVLTLTQEQDESEVYTAAVGRGRGEEAGDGFGPRLEFGDIAWSKDGITKPIGQNYIELPSATAEYGFIENGILKPRIAPEVVFEDIEDKKKLADATYYWLLENCLPKATWKTEVARIGNLELGDTVGVLYKAAGIIKRARVEKIEYNLLDPELSKLTLGDFHHFENRQMKRIKAQIKRLSRDSNDRITRIKNEWNGWIDNQFTAAMNQFEQNLIDQKALIEADRENMTNLIEDTRTEWTESFNASVAEARRLREENYAAMSEYVNTSVDTARTDLESDIASNIAESERKAQLEHDEIERRVTDTVDTTREELEVSINTSIESAKQYAEQQAQAKSEAVRTDLETVTSGHQGMLESLQDNVMNIDDFLGDKTVGLNELLYNERMLFEEKLSNVDTWHYNMLRGTRFDEGYWTPTFGEIRTDEDTPYFYFDPETTTSSLPYVQSTQEVVFEQGEVYRLSFDWQTYAVRAIDYVFIIASPDDGGGNINIGVSTSTDRISGTNLFTSFGSEYGRYYIEFSPNRTIRGFIRIGANLNNNEHGRRGFKIRLPYLTTTENTRWLYHQLDATQNIEEITRRVMQLEDGYEEVITRNEYDFKTGEIEGTIKNVIETVDESTLIMQNHENWILTNGSSIERTVDGFDSKAWLSDIHNPNMLQYTDFTKQSHINRWRLVSATAVGMSYGEYIVATTYNSNLSIAVRSRDVTLVAGKQYTLSFIGVVTTSEVSNNTFDFLYVQHPSKDNQLLPVPKREFIGTIGTGGVHEVAKYTVTFTARETDEYASIYIGTRNSATGQAVSIRVKEPKLEMGSRATPYYNAFSSLSQRADEIALAVQGIGEQGFLNQSDIVIRPDYVNIGSQRIDGDDIGSFLRVSPSGIDMVAEAMRLSGDLYVDGDITALAVNAVRGDIAYLKTNILTADSVNATHIESETIGASQIRANSVLINKLFANSFAAGHISTVSLEAVEGEFASLFAAQLNATTITAEHIGSKSITVDEILIDDALVETIVARSVFADDVTSKIGNFIDLNAGNIVTAGLSANVITSDHIQVGTQLVDELFATSARIDELITKSHFVNEMHALTLNVVDLNASEIRARLLTANTIEAEWLKVGTTLIDRLFATTAMFERMMSKSGFVTTLNTVTIDTDQITIRRPDGGALISQGMQRFGSPIITKPFMTGDVYFENQNYVTGSRGAETFEVAFAEHSGRWATFNFNISLRHDSKDASALVGVVVRRGTSPPDVHIAHEYREFMAYRDSGSRSYNVDVRLPVPTYGALSWTLEFYVIGDLGNYARIRSGRCWVSS